MWNRKRLTRCWRRRRGRSTSPCSSLCLERNSKAGFSSMAVNMWHVEKLTHNLSIREFDGDLFHYRCRSRGNHPQCLQSVWSWREGNPEEGIVSCFFYPIYLCIKCIFIKDSKQPILSLFWPEIRLISLNRFSSVSLRCWPHRRTDSLQRRWGVWCLMIDSCHGYGDSTADCRVIFRWSRCSPHSLQMLRETWTTGIWSISSLTERRRTRNSSFSPQPIPAFPVCSYPPTGL